MSDAWLTIVTVTAIAAAVFGVFLIAERMLRRALRRLGRHSSLLAELAEHAHPGLDRDRCLVVGRRPHFGRAGGAVPLAGERTGQSARAPGSDAGHPRTPGHHGHCRGDRAGSSILEGHEPWDGRVCVLQVIDAVNPLVHVHALVSAADAPSLCRPTSSCVRSCVGSCSTRIRGSACGCRAWIPSTRRSRTEHRRSNRLFATPPTAGRGNTPSRTPRRTDISDHKGDHGDDLPRIWQRKTQITVSTSTLGPATLSTGETETSTLVIASRWHSAQVRRSTGDS